MYIQLTDASLGFRNPCYQGQSPYLVKGYRPRQACTGMEINITECGGIQIDKFCGCGTVGGITCLAGKNHYIVRLELITKILISVNIPTENLDDKTTTLAITNQTTTINNHESDTTNTSTESEPSTMTLQEPNTSDVITILAIVVGVLMVLVTIALIVICLVVVCKKRSTLHQQR